MGILCASDCVRWRVYHFSGLHYVINYTGFVAAAEYDCDDNDDDDDSDVMW